MATNNLKILFPTSSGGHLTEVLQLKKLYAGYDHLIVTEDLELNKKILDGKNYLLVKPNGKNRDLIFWKNFIINWFLAFRIIRKFRPNIIVTTGSHTAVPFCFIGKLLGIKVVYILSFARIDSRAKSADIIYPIADLFFVQWEQMLKYYKKGIYVGPLF
jgi:beta-1,4-N-acetylglucosaminyltransferase